jgi:hypothetical protein
LPSPSGDSEGENPDCVDAPLFSYEIRPKIEINWFFLAVVAYDRMGTPADLAGMAINMVSSGADCVVARPCRFDDGNWMS